MNENNKLYSLSSRKEFMKSQQGNAEGVTMFTGNIIDELIAAVQRAEGCADNNNRQQEAPAYETSNTEAALAGVA